MHRILRFMQNFPYETQKNSFFYVIFSSYIYKFKY